MVSGLLRLLLSLLLSALTISAVVGIVDVVAVVAVNAKAAEVGAVIVVAVVSMVADFWGLQKLLQMQWVLRVPLSQLWLQVPLLLLLLSLWVLTM